MTHCRTPSPVMAVPAQLSFFANLRRNMGSCGIELVANIFASIINHGGTTFGAYHQKQSAKAYCTPVNWSWFLHVSRLTPTGPLSQSETLVDNTRSPFLLLQKITW